MSLIFLQFSLKIPHSFDYNIFISLSIEHSFFPQKVLVAFPARVEVAFPARVDVPLPARVDVAFPCPKVEVAFPS